MSLLSSPSERFSTSCSGEDKTCKPSTFGYESKLTFFALKFNVMLFCFVYVFCMNVLLFLHRTTYWLGLMDNIWDKWSTFYRHHKNIIKTIKCIFLGFISVKENILNHSTYNLDFIFNIVFFSLFS